MTTTEVQRRGCTNLPIASTVSLTTNRLAPSPTSGRPVAHPVTAIAPITAMYTATATASPTPPSATAPGRMRRPTTRATSSTTAPSQPSTGRSRPTVTNDAT